MPLDERPCIRGQYAVVFQLNKAEASVHACDHQGRTPLHLFSGLCPNLRDLYKTGLDAGLHAWIVEQGERKGFSVATMTGRNCQEQPLLLRLLLLLRPVLLLRIRVFCGNDCTMPGRIRDEKRVIAWHSCWNVVPTFVQQINRKTYPCLWCAPRDDGHAFTSCFNRRPIRDCFIMHQQKENMLFIDMPCLFKMFS